jgi:hypothetical protein
MASALHLKSKATWHDRVGPVRATPAPSCGSQVSQPDELTFAACWQAAIDASGSAGSATQRSGSVGLAGLLARQRDRLADRIEPYDRGRVVDNGRVADSAAAVVFDSQVVQVVGPRAAGGHLAERVHHSGRG